MEPLQAFVLTDANKIELISLTRHSILHATQALQPSVSLSAVLPKSGTHKVESFCAELREAILTKPLKKKSSSTNLLTDQPLVQPLEIHKFCDGATSPAEFTMAIEERLIARSKENGLDLEKLHKTCWNYYEVEKKLQISHPKWLSQTCTYRLWLIFNCVLEHELKTMMSIRSLNEVLRRVIELCGFTWNESDKYDGYGTVDFPLYLEVIVSSFENFRLETMLTCEVIGDMVDEIIHGVLKKGFLTKKGHKRKNWKRRWFILQRTTMSYYESREDVVPNGKFILNSNTDVKSMPDRGKRKCIFEVTCGNTGKPFEIAADDQRMKQEWMLAIKKAIALAKILEGSSKQDDFTESLAGFYLLKYGTPKPNLARQDSTIRKMKYNATMKQQRTRLSGKKISSEEILLQSRSSIEDSQEYTPMSPQDEYMAMAPLDDFISSDDSSGSEGKNYTTMNPILCGFDDSYENPNPTTSLPSRTCPMEIPSHPHSASFSGGNGPPPIRARTFTQQPLSPTILEPSHEEEENETDLAYEDANFKVASYKLHPQDKQLGGYVEMTLDGQWKDVIETHSDHDDPPDEKQNEDDLLKPTDNSLDHDHHKSIPKYLTLMRDPDTKQFAVSTDSSPSPDYSRPVVPPHRQSLPTNQLQTTPPPVSPRHSSAGFKHMPNGQSELSPPPPPPRTILPHSSTPLLAGVPLPFPTAQHPFHSTSDPEPGPTSPSSSVTSNERLRSISEFDFDPVLPPPLPPR